MVITIIITMVINMVMMMIKMVMMNMVLMMMKDLLRRSRAVIGSGKVDAGHAVVVTPQQLREGHIHKRSP